MKILALFLALPVAVALRGVVLMLFWAWFVAPVVDVPLLGLMQAVGLSVAATAFTDGSGGSAFKLSAIATAVGAKEPEPLEAAIQSIIYPLVVLFFGWLLHFFV